MDMLESFMLALLLKATREKRKDEKAWLSYNWGLAVARDQQDLESSAIEKSYIALQGLYT